MGWSTGLTEAGYNFAVWRDNVAALRPAGRPAQRAHAFQLSGRAEHLVLVRDVLGIGGHERLAGRARIEIAGLVAERSRDRLAHHTSRPSVSMFTLVTPSLAAGRYWSSCTPLASPSLPPALLMRSTHSLRHAARAVHHQRKARQQLLNLGDAVEVQALLAGELVGAVRGADGHGQRVAAAALDELDGLVRIGQAGVVGVDRDVFFDAAQHAQLGLDRDALVVGPLDDAARDRDVLVERFVRGVDHHRGIEAAVDAVVADFFGAVIEVDGEDGFVERPRRPCGSWPRETACRCSRGHRARSG